MTFNLILFNFQLIFHIIEEVILSSLMKIIELHKVLEFEIFPNGIQIFSKTLWNSNGRSHVIFTLGFCVEMNLNSWTSNCKDESFGKVLLFPLIQLSKVSNSTHFQSINQTNNHIIYLI